MRPRLAACSGGGARSLPATTGSPDASHPAAAGQPAAGSGNIGLSAQTLQFSATGWSATQIVTTTWTDDSRKSAVSSDPTVATVSPPYQQATFTAPGVYSAKYWVTPVGPGTAMITFSDHDGSESATLSVSVTGPTTQTLYVASAGEVDAFPAAASGATAPQRRVTGFFKPRVRPENISSAAAAITVGPDGTLYVVKNTSYPSSAACAVIVESANANGASGTLSTIACGARGAGVTTTPGGELDVLTRPTSTTTAVERFVNGSPTSSLTISGDPSALASGPNGDLEVSAFADGLTVQGRVDQYAPGAPDGATPLRSIGAPDKSFFGAVAVAPNGELYAVYIVPNYQTGISTQTISAYAPGSSTASRALGPFTSDTVTGIAVGKGGELYVAFNSVRYAGSRSRVDVYAPDANGSASPIRTIPNPIPSDAAGGTSIVAIPLSPAAPPPPEEILSRHRHP